MSVINGYTTVEDLRTHLGDSQVVTNTALLERAINAASRAVDDYCNRRFWQDAAVTTRVFKATEPDVVWVDDISSTTGLVVATDDTGNGAFDTTWTAGVDYQLEPLNGGVVAGGDIETPFAFWILTAVGTRPWPVFDRRAGVQVTARFGWSSVPDEVVEATILKAAALFKRKDAPLGIAGVGELGVMRISRQDPDVIDLLRRYVKARPRSLTYRAQRFSLYHQRLT